MESLQEVVYTRATQGTHLPIRPFLSPNWELASPIPKLASQIAEVPDIQWWFVLTETITDT